MQTMTIPQIKDVLHHIAYRHRQPVMIWGPPGCGKSDGVQQFSDGIDGYLCDIRLSSYESVDMHGLPDLEGDLTHWKPPATLPFVVNGKPSPLFPQDRPIVLFFDEVNSASQGVFAVLYQLTLDGAVNEHKLMDNVVIVLAGNRESDRGVATRLPTPLLNRLTHVEAAVNVDAWVYDYAIPAELPPIAIAFAQWKQEQALMTFDPASGEKVFSTPRSYAKAAKFWGDENMPKFVRQAAICGTIGTGVATEFFAFADNWENMIPLDEVRADPHNCRLPREDELSTRWSMAVSISGDMDRDSADVYYPYLERLGEELLVVAFSMAIRRDEVTEKKTGKPAPKSVDQSDAFMKFAKDYKKIWSAS